MEEYLQLLLHYVIPIAIVITNVLAFALMGIDKHKAVKGAWRIPEKTLFLFPILFGSLGGLLGMKAFHHKTKHWYFKVGFTVLFILQIALTVLILLKVKQVI